MKTNKTLITICMTFFLISLASAQVQITLEVKDNFTYGQEVYFNYTLTTQEDIENLIYTPYIYCDGSPQPLLNKETINLIAGQSYSKNYIYGVIDDNYNSGECTASVSIEQPFQQYLAKSFTITSKKDLDFSLVFPKKVFVKNENILLNYASSVSSLTISAILTYPDKSSKEITFPFEFKAEQIGTYSLNLKVSKEGYKEISKIEQFAVIEKEASFSSQVSAQVTDDNPLSSNSVIPSLGDSPSLDPLESVSGGHSNSFNILLGIVIGLIVLVIILIYFLWRKSKSDQVY